MKFLSVCSGIEAASVAWAPLGWKAWAFSEIDAFAGAVLAHHYPDVPNLGDMTKFKDWPDADLDLLCGGTPCQSFSNAGLRAGLDDPRGQLMLTFAAVAARYRPRWLVWENVPGVLSSDNGRDFASLLGVLSGQQIEPPADGWKSAGVVAGIPDAYGLAWRVLDAQFVRVDGYARAVPQRRQRVFVVGCLGDWRRAAAVFLEREGLRGDPAPRRSSGARVAATLTRGAESSGRGGYAGRRQEDDYNIVAGALAGTGPGAGWRIGADEAAANHVVAYGGNNTRGPRDVASALSAHGGTGRHDFETETFVAHTLRADGFDASEDGTGRGTPLVPVHLPEVHPTMVARSSRGGGQTNTPGHNADETLIAFDTYNQSVSAEAQTLCSRGDTPGGNAHLVPAVLQAAAVRRLMPVECERLQGFEDDYTRIPTWNGWRKLDEGETPEQCIESGLEVRQNKKTGAWRVKDVDGPRYKALGNSWAVNCARWIGYRIAIVDAMAADQRRAA